MTTQTAIIQPQTDIDFCTDVVGKLMPPYAEIPADFKRSWNPYVRLSATWFFKGLDANVLKTKPGIDRRAALAHLSAIQGSWEPQHEHKEAAVAYLMSLWFDIA